LKLTVPTPEPQTQQDILSFDSFVAPVRFSFLGTSSSAAAAFLLRSTVLALTARLRVFYLQQKRAAKTRRSRSKPVAFTFLWAVFLGAL
jgi:hypothetical protein